MTTSETRAHPLPVPRAPRIPKHGYHHGDLRRALLDAALRILVEEGPHALTLREVARRVGVTQAAPYHHFADKDAILAAVAEEGFTKLHESMIGARDAAGAKPTARLRAMGAGYVRFAVQHPAHFRVMFEKMVDMTEHASLHACADQSFAVLLDAVTEGQKAGQVRKGSAAELALLLWSTMHGLATLWLSGAATGPTGPVGTIESLADAATEMLVRGLAR